MNDVRDKAIQFYDELRKYYGEYHNRKETAGWAGVILHFGFCAAVFKAASAPPPTPAANIIVTAVSIVECVFLISYVQWQFSLKDKGGALFAAAIALQIELMKLTNQDDVLRYLAVETSENELFQSPHVLPVVLLKRADAIDQKGRAAQDALKWSTFALLVISSLAVIANRWT